MVVNLTSNHSQLNARISWWYTEQNIDGNYSKVSAQLEVSKNQDIATSGHWAGNFQLGSESTVFNTYASVTEDWACVAELGPVTVYHDANGEASIYMYGRVVGPSGTSMSSASASGSSTESLDTIIRDAKLLTAENFTDEGNPTITYENKAGNSMGTFQAGIFSSDGSTAYAAYRNISKTDGSYTFNLTTAERNKLRAAIPDAKSMTVQFKLKYVIGSTTKYSTISKTLTITNANPTISPTIVDTDSTTIALTGNSSTLVKYFSDAQVTIGASALKSATIESQKCLNGSYTLSTASGTFTNIESEVFKFTVTDSRGFSATKTVTAPYVPYVKLTANFTTNISLDGALKIKVKGNYFNGSFGAVSNILNVSYRYKLAGGEWNNWVGLAPSYGPDDYEANDEFMLSNFDYRNAYVFQVKANDMLISIESDEYTVKAMPVFDWSGEDFAFNVPVTILGKPVYVEDVLYYNAGGSASTITLSDTVSNYDYIEVFYTDNNGAGYGYTKVYDASGAELHLSLVESVGTGAFYIRHCNWTVSGNTITPETSTAAYAYYNGNSWSYSNANYTKIYRVVGHKGVS